MYELPDIKKRLIVLDTEVSGKTGKDHIIELCAFEMIEGKLNTKNKFHSFFKPKNYMSKYLIRAHRIPYKAFYYTFEEERKLYLQFLDFIKDSIIITHNAAFDMEKINKALKYYKLPIINRLNFRCSMRIFWEYFYNFSLKFSKLKECCEFFNIKYKYSDLHLASYDAFLVGKIMEIIFKELPIYKDIKIKNTIIDYKNKINDKEINNENENNENFILKKKDMILINNELNNIKNNYKKDKKEDKELEDFIDKNIESILVNNNSSKKDTKKEDKDLEDFIDNNIESIVNKFKEEESLEDFINKNIEDILNKFKNNEDTEFQNLLRKKRK